MVEFDNAIELNSGKLGILGAAHVDTVFASDQVHPPPPTILPCLPSAWTLFESRPVNSQRSVHLFASKPD